MTPMTIAPVSAAAPCGVPGGVVCSAKTSGARPVYAAMLEKRKPVSTSAFPQCKGQWDKDKSCPSGAGFRLEGDKRLMKGGMYKGDKTGNGGSGDRVLFKGKEVAPR